MNVKNTETKRKKNSICIIPNKQYALQAIQKNDNIFI